MFDLGLGEIVVLALIALVVVGPEQIPGVARSLGYWVRRARSIWSRMSEDIESSLDLEHRAPERESEESSPGESHDPPAAQ